MYFPGEESNPIAIDDRNRRCIRVNAELYAGYRITTNNILKSFWDTHLLSIRDDKYEQECFSEVIMRKGDVIYLGWGYASYLFLCMYCIYLCQISSSLSLGKF